MVRSTVWLRSASMVNEPQFGYSAGIGLFFIQPPIANWLKSSQGLHERSKFSSLNPHPLVPPAPFAHKAPRLPITKITTVKIRRTRNEDAIFLPNTAGTRPAQTTCSNLLSLANFASFRRGAAPPGSPFRSGVEQSLPVAQVPAIGQNDRNTSQNAHLGLNSRVEQPLSRAEKSAGIRNCTGVQERSDLQPKKSTVINVLVQFGVPQNI